MADGSRDVCRPLGRFRFGSLRFAAAQAAQEAAAGGAKKATLGARWVARISCCVGKQAARVNTSRSKGNKLGFMFFLVIKDNKGVCSSSNGS